MDTMHIRDLAVQCVIGTRPEERERKQRILVNLELECDLRNAGKSDMLKDTVNYSDLRHEIVEMAESSSFRLIEKLAEEIARICLRDRIVSAVTVTVDKPAALEEARSAAVIIRRKRG